MVGPPPHPFTEVPRPTKPFSGSRVVGDVRCRNGSPDRVGAGDEVKGKRTSPGRGRRGYPSGERGSGVALPVGPDSSSRRPETPSPLASPKEALPSAVEVQAEEPSSRDQDRTRDPSLRHLLSPEVRIGRSRRTEPRATGTFGGEPPVSHGDVPSPSRDSGLAADVWSLGWSSTEVSLVKEVPTTTHLGLGCRTEHDGPGTRRYFRA